ncbi:MAG: SDR family oxidoreductase [Robiginitomaculum sp.]|nr:SDR family oxidoreductase [Robiginitomaculum sp.]
MHGTYNVIQSALAHMPDNGRIINIASVLGLRGVPDQPAYCASKHAVVGLTRSLALRLAPRKITVNAVCPGWVKTDMSAKRAHELAVSTDALGHGVPLGRMALPEEVANLVHYIASDAARMITGQTLTLDGGATA